MSTRKKLIAGNWKMNKTSADGVSLVAELVATIGKQSDVEVVVCPPFTALESAAKAIDGSTLKLGAQNMHFEANGSERRALFGETDALVNKKVLAALKNQLRPILCVGETLAEREAGSTLAVVQTQLEAGLEGVGKDQAASVVIAYEPVWAIGTGKVATTEQAQEVHAFIRGLLTKHFTDAVAQKVRILYGGSMKPANAPELLAQKDIDGGLIGGASLEARSFVELVNAAAAVV